MISTITSRTGSYQSTPLVVRGEPGGELARRFVILGDVLYKRSFKGYSPFLILNRKKERTLLNKLIQEARPPYKKRTFEGMIAAIRSCLT
jgi:hypothetical protein